MSRLRLRSGRAIGDVLRGVPGARLIGRVQFGEGSVCPICACWIADADTHGDFHAAVTTTYAQVEVLAEEVCRLGGNPDRLE